MSTLQNELRRLKFNEPDPSAQPQTPPELPAPARDGKFLRDYTYADALRVYQTGNREELLRLRDAVCMTLQHVQMQLEQSRLSQDESEAWLFEQGYSKAEVDAEVADWTEASWRRRAKMVVFNLNRWTTALKRRLAAFPLAPETRTVSIFPDAGKTGEAATLVLRQLITDGFAVQAFSAIGGDLVVLYYKR